MEAEITSKLKMLTMETYDGLNDRIEHMETYESFMELHVVQPIQVSSFHSFTKWCNSNII